MVKTYHVNVADRVENALLTVRGRKSGQQHTVPVVLVEQDGHRFLVAPYGVVQWVRNIRAAGTATLTRGRHSEEISVTELEAREAAPVLKQYLSHVSAGVRSYFDAKRDSPLEAFEREASRHPVFQITAVEKPYRRTV
jgi:deazaflavin-dependent oxidoreductase (nitroreductase family)